MRAMYAVFTLRNFCFLSLGFQSGRPSASVLGIQNPDIAAQQAGGRHAATEQARTRPMARTRWPNEPRIWSQAEWQCVEAQTRARALAAATEEAAWEGLVRQAR